MGERYERGSRPRAKRRFGSNPHRHGDEMGGETERVLSALQAQNKITNFVRHREAGTEDGPVENFSVTMLVDGRDVTVRFGVSVSRREWQRMQSRAQDVPQLCFPLGTRPDTIRRRILSLFAS